MDSDTLRHSKLETLEHICSWSQDTRKVLGLDPTDYLIPAIVTVLLAPDSGFESKAWVEFLLFCYLAALERIGRLPDVWFGFLFHQMR